MIDIPLKVLIVDPYEPSAELLMQYLSKMKKTVLSVKRATSLFDARNALIESDINTIYIDPLSLSYVEAGEFIFDVRKRLPAIVFVLYLDLNKMEKIRTEFFDGERKRLSHYFRLDKLTPISFFEEELSATIRQCQSDLSYILTNEKINKLQEELSFIQTKASKEKENVNVPMSILRDIQEQLEALKKNREEKIAFVNPKSIFLSYRFADKEYVEGFIMLLEENKFIVKTGQDVNTFISQAILDSIKSCEFFVSLMTKADEKKDGTFTTSPWLLEEKGAALAMGKKIVLMVEENVKDIGGLQGDWQQIRFSPKTFMIAALKAVKQLKSYSGEKSDSQKNNDN